VEELH